jgi:hypothetical protein
MDREQRIERVPCVGDVYRDKDTCVLRTVQRVDGNADEVEWAGDDGWCTSFGALRSYYTLVTPALEQREPTIEERFPVGSRWRWTPSPKDYDALPEEFTVRRVLRNACKGHLIEDEKGQRWLAAPEWQFTRLDDTPPAQPVDRDVTPENVSKPVAVGDVLRVVGRHTFFDVGDDWIVCELGVDPQGAHMRQRSDGPRASVWCPASLFPKVFGFVLSKKPAPTCEAPGYAGSEHPVDADEYLVCRVCRASESDRRRERRRAFDRRYVAAVETVLVPHREEPEAPVRCEERWRAVLGSHAAIGPTESEAANALFERMERARE